MSLQQVATTCGLPASTTHRLLKQLQDLDIVIQAPDRRYMVGSDLLFMGAMVSSTHRLMKAAEPAIDEIFGRCQKSCVLSLYLREKRGRLATDVDPERAAAGLSCTRFRDLVWGCTGRAILAFLDHDQIEQITASPGRSPTGRAPPDRSILRESLIEIRSRGYAYSQGEVSRYGVAVAVPIFQPDRQIVGSIAVTEQRPKWDRAEQERLAELLARQAARISRSLHNRKSLGA